MSLNNYGRKNSTSMTMHQKKSIDQSQKLDYRSIKQNFDESLQKLVMGGSPLKIFGRKTDKYDGYDTRVKTEEDLKTKI